MTEKELFGCMEAERGAKCSNSGYGARWTTPCCYTDLREKADKCPTCGAPIVCTVEEEPVSVCRIADADE
jgi:hypothetical protein